MDRNMLSFTIFLLCVPMSVYCDDIFNDATHAYSSIEDPILKDIVDYSLMKIGDVAELTDLLSVKIEAVSGLKYTLDMLVVKYYYDPYGSKKVDEHCVIELVDQPDLRWVTDLHCTPIDGQQR